MKAGILKQCQEVFPDWRGLSLEDFTFAPPKGFSSFTVGIRCLREVEPRAALYRRLEGKENAILDFEAEKEVFLTLGQAGIAARCHYYGDDCRIEAFFHGRTLTAGDLEKPENLRGIANELYRLHQLRPAGLPHKHFFELLHHKWGQQARRVLVEQRDLFPPHERRLCQSLTEIYSEQTLQKVLRCLPKTPLGFCHNDTYHGNVMKLDDGRIKLLDFEFSCLNHKAYDFSNLFAETVMRHGLPSEPYFSFAKPRFDDADIGQLIGFYLENAKFSGARARKTLHNRLVAETRDMIPMSDYVYAMAALPLAVQPIQKIRFLPYSHQRFRRFLRSYRRRFGNTRG